MQGGETDGLHVQPGLLDGEGSDDQSDDQEDVSAEFFSENPVRKALIAAGEMSAILRDLGLDDTALEADMVVSAAPTASSRPAPTTPNIQLTATSNPYRAYQWALAAALALTCGTTRYLVAGSDASGSDTVSASTVTLPPIPRIEPIDPAFEAAKEVAKAELRHLNGFAYIPTCERVATASLDARKSELTAGHKVIEHDVRPDLNVPSHVDFGVAPLGKNDSVLCWTQHPGLTHP